MPHPPRVQPQDAQAAWQAGMVQQIERLRQRLLGTAPEQVAERAGAAWDGARLRLSYWGRPAQLAWPALPAVWDDDGTACSLYDQAMLLYYLTAADGTALSGRWAALRELPDGAFYHQAYQGYSGDLLARRLARQPERLAAAAGALGGWPLPEINPYAYAFEPLPRLRLALVYWPGDEDFPDRAAVLFDASARHYLPIDGCALLGAALARRLGKLVEGLPSSPSA